ncbi:LysM peptidoglycan-binding domain-containing protein [Pseudomonas kielensis]|uniref:CIS tube protein n=1 Tax=Pseudomonas kielensis TaxID=2762577 RepID=UPI00223E9DAA|nr:hypothetical protein [Pseudomonas kielensis]UZM16229.1 LysM peptidoglycan-binding domain-containing protein [Pseudomonas kielensis]
MKGLLEFGLSKLKITAYRKRDRNPPDKLGEMRVMYNPDSLDLRYDIDYDADSYINGGMRLNHYKQARPGELQLELLFDASLPGSQQSVESQLAALQMLCCEVDPGTHETPYLKIEWGKMNWHGEDHFAGRAASLQVKYTRFNRKAEPQRAIATLTLTADSSQTLQATELAKLAAQQASSRIPDMSWLPMAAATLASIAGMRAFSVLDVAKANDLDSLDAIKPGDTLVVPSETADTEVAP